MLPASTKTEITDFLAASPTDEQIIAYRLPDTLQERALELLAWNRENTITFDERNDMHEFMQMDHFMTLLKAKMRLKLARENK